MKINEVASAAEQLALWRLISDTVWAVVQQQADAEAAERAAAAAPRPRRRGSAPATPPRSRAPRPIASPLPNTPTSNAPPAAVKPVQQTTSQLSKPSIDAKDDDGRMMARVKAKADQARERQRQAAMPRELAATVASTTQMRADANNVVPAAPTPKR